MSKLEGKSGLAFEVEKRRSAWPRVVREVLVNDLLELGNDEPVPVDVVVGEGHERIENPLHERHGMAGREKKKLMLIS